MKPLLEKAKLEFTLITEFDDKTVVKKEMADSGMKNIYSAIRECLVECGYLPETVNRFFPEKE